MSRAHGVRSAAAGAVLAVLLSACGPAYRGVPLYGPLPSPDPQVMRGERVFTTHCNTCHPGGTAGLGPGINDKPLPGGLIELQVRVGFGAMPSFGEDRIDDEELDALVAYLLALRAQEPSDGA